MKKILTIASVVMFITVFLGVGVICAQEVDKKLIKKVEDEHAKIAQRHKELMQRINLGAQENAKNAQAKGKEAKEPVKNADSVILWNNPDQINIPDTRLEGFPEVTVYNPDGTIKEAGDAKDLRAPLIEYEDGKVASLTIFGSDGKPAYRHAYGADGKIKYTVNYDKDAGLGDEFVLKAPIIEYKDGKIASLTIFGSDGKPADKYTFDENGKIVEKIQYGTGNDINGDGKINELDIEAVRSHTGAVIGNPLYNENADLNHDGRITGTDVVLIRNAINEKDLRMPAKEPYEGVSPGKKPVAAEPERMSENIPVIEKPVYVKPEPVAENKNGNSVGATIIADKEITYEKPGAAGYPHPTPPDLNRIIGNDDQEKPGPSGNVRYDNAAEFSEMKDVENKVGAQMQSNVQISRTMAGDTQGQGEMLPLQKPE